MFCCLRRRPTDERPNVHFRFAVGGLSLVDVDVGAVANAFLQLLSVKECRCVRCSLFRSSLCC